MKKFVIKKNDSGQRLDKFVAKAAAGLSPSLVYKYIRKKSIKVNGKRAEISYRLQENDVVEMYINDEFFIPKKSGFLNIGYDPTPDIVYEDENMILVDKKPGVLVHESINEKRDTLINQILLYLYNKGEYSPDSEISFTPSLCNRLDKNTGGIVIIAKNAKAQRLLYDIVKYRKITKKYLALVHGAFKVKSAVLTAYLKKDSSANIVDISDFEKEGYRKIITKYTVIDESKDMSLVEIDLVTGRTHQIRAHMAHIGHPVVGDCKYGYARDNKKLPFAHQALYAYSLEFKIDDEKNDLYYLNGRVFRVKKVYFEDFLCKKQKQSNLKK